MNPLLLALQLLSVGDTVVRRIGPDEQGVDMRLEVTALAETLIHCGPWTFDLATGVEVDDDLEWGPKYGQSGSRLIAVIWVSTPSPEAPSEAL